MTADRDPARFRERIRAEMPLVGLFIKTAAYPQIEVLARADIDFVIFDAEHAPFDAQALDACIMAARAGNLPNLVRIQALRPEIVLSVLDMGATGILVPHVVDAEMARRAVSLSRYRGGERGFATSHRAGGYSARGMAEHIARSDAETVVLCQIEDAKAVPQSAAIGAVEGVDGLFIGRADLALSLGADSLDHETVAAAVAEICAAGRDAGATLAMFLPGTAQMAAFRDLGVSLFVVGSDQGVLRGGANAMAQDFRQNI